MATETNIFGLSLSLEMPIQQPLRISRRYVILAATVLGAILALGSIRPNLRVCRSPLA